MKSLRVFFARMLSRLNEFFGRGLVVAMGAILAIGLVAAVAVLAFVNSATPTSLTLASGPKGSSYERNAEKYQKILAKQGVTLKIVPSEGSLDNLKKLSDPKAKVDVAFVMGGEATPEVAEKLVSLGSIAYQPLMIFYRGEKKTLLSEFKGQTLYIDEEGSGTHTLALTLLKANGLGPQDVRLATKDLTEDPVKALRNKHLDALFLMGDSASTDFIRELLHADGIRLFSFAQAEGYSRRIAYLNKLELPMGALDFGKNTPSEDTYLLAPTVELVARPGLHPALSDLLLEAAKEVHGNAGLFKKRGEFPAPQEHEFRISEDAARYYTSGKSFLYRSFPFWAASLIARLLAVVVPIALILIPALKMAPAVYRWRMESRIRRWYRALFDLEREAFHSPLDEKKRQELVRRLAHIENGVNKIVVPATFGDLFYGLRSHITLVRDGLSHQRAPEASKEG